MSNPPVPAVYTVAHINVKITGVTDSAPSMSPLLFKSCTPPHWSVEAPKNVFHGDQGQPVTIISSVQKSTWGPMTLTQGWDTGFVLAKWKATIDDQTKAITDKQKEVLVDFLQSNGTDKLYSFHTTTGIMTGFQPGGSDPSSHTPLVLTVTIEANDWVLFDANGAAITPL
jgi:hypothetical protein